MVLRRRALGHASAAALGVALAPLAGCTRSDDRSLRFWAMGREGEVAHELLADWRAAHPEVKLRIEQLPWSAAHEKLLTAFAGDATPDLAQLGNTWLPELAAIGALAPIEPWLAHSPEVAVADYFSGIWATNRVAGPDATERLYGLPWYVDTRLLFYRSDLLAAAGYAQVPDTWAGWLDSMRAVQRRGAPDAHAVLLPLNEYDPIVALALQQAEPLLRDGGRFGHFRGDGFRRTLAFYLGLFRERLAPAAAAAEIANVWNEFARGAFTYYITGPWQIGEFRRRLPAALQDAWATAPLPGPDGPGASIAGGSSLALFARSRRKPEAWALMRHLARPDVQQRFHALTGNLPPRRSAWAGGTLASDAPTQAFRAQLERVRPVPAVPEWERIATELRLALEQVVRGVLPAARLPEVLDARTDRLLEKRRWMLDQARAA